ncbi:MAG: hypothetical protein ACPG5U_00565 [Planktomarina sp.]
MFRSNEDGAMMGDWVISLSAILGLGATAVFTMGDGLLSVSNDMSDQLSQVDVSIEMPDSSILSAAPFGTRLEGIQYASHFTDGSNGSEPITAQTADGWIRALNDQSSSELKATYDSLSSISYPTPAMALATDIARDLLIERGQFPSDQDEDEEPTETQPTVPTPLTAANFIQLWEGETPVASQTDVETLIAEFNQMEDATFLAARNTLTASWQSTIFLAIAAQRGLAVT